MIARHRSIEDQTRIAPSLPTGYWLLAPGLMATDYWLFTTGYWLLPAFLIPDHCSLTTGFPAFLTTNHYPLITGFRAFLTTNHYPLITAFYPTPPCLRTHPHPFLRPHPPMPFCETVKLWSL